MVAPIYSTKGGNLLIVECYHQFTENISQGESPHWASQASVKTMWGHWYFPQGVLTRSHLMSINEALQEPVVQLLWIVSGLRQRPCLQLPFRKIIPIVDPAKPPLSIFASSCPQKDTIVQKNKKLSSTPSHLLRSDACIADKACSSRNREGGSQLE